MEKIVKDLIKGLKRSITNVALISTLSLIPLVGTSCSGEYLTAGGTIYSQLSGKSAEIGAMKYYYDKAREQWDLYENARDCIKNHEGDEAHKCPDPQQYYDAWLEYTQQMNQYYQGY